MEFNRNHYFMAGVVLLLLGIQLRLVDSYVLNEESTRMFNARSEGVSLTSIRPLLQSVSPPSRKVVKPPESLGWALMSIGSVLILHALAMKGPGGDH
ncbi:MAG TPA: hypothetical protein VG125_30525 [Pirellulales bacterium]|jgi:hypothetical protein|nr:hypothetical protein [Pirellulales bacterium]